ncbi:hypothetical protein [Billgrantia lactosivorans]|uniref:hypothetical protein n=1 Tax=Billgrantia lactosivorans TaxID=2185141 RepID=UPI0013A6CCBE|nr:hypothetical protein [Halomonas lactosivorans]
MSHKFLRSDTPQKAGNGWSNGWHTQTTTAESLRILRKSAFSSVRSTAKAAATVDGWKRASSLGGKLLAGSLALAAGLAHGMFQSAASPSSDSEEEKQDLGWGDFGAGYGYYGKDGNRLD